ncbi:MAG: ABC transporter permease [Bifidobacterium sp.]|nr:ABC transporter permease [Bifidobacterium sp.]
MQKTASEDMKQGIQSKVDDMKAAQEKAAAEQKELMSTIETVIMSAPAAQRAQMSEQLKALQDASSSGAGISADDFAMNTDKYMPITSTETTYLHGTKDWKMFDFYGPVFIGIFLFVFTFLTSGMSLVTERAGGTMQRFLATPVRPLQILGGYTLGFGILACVQSAVILWVALGAIHFPNEGNVFLVILMTVSMAMVSVTMGLLVSGLAATAFQVIQLILLFVLPQVLLCGLFDLSGAPTWMQWLSKVMPVTYGVDALQSIMLRGWASSASGTTSPSSGASSSSSSRSPPSASARSAPVCRTAPPRRPPWPAPERGASLETSRFSVTFLGCWRSRP